MANSKITITFLDGIIADDYLDFGRYRFTAPLSQSQIETFKVPNPRTSSLTVVLGASGILNATNYVTAFNNDYNGGSIYIIVRYSNVVEIQFINELWGFNNWSTNSAYISAIIENYSAPVGFINVIANTRTNATSDLCGKFKAGFTTDVLATTIKLNGVTLTTTNTSNPYSYDVVRGIPNRFDVYSAEGYTHYINFLTVPFLTSENITVVVTQLINGATLNVNVANSTGLNLEYSLDGSNWQSSNIFTGQEVGQSFLYVRDQFGCVQSKLYEVTLLGNLIPYLYISIANSINFSKQEVWDGCSIFKNDSNTLSCQGLEKFKHITKILFQTCDSTTIQFKSNYETISANLVDSLDNTSALTVTKMSANLNRFQSLDGTYYKYRTGKLGIYFDTGNTYDELGAIIDTYTLGGNLPEFAILGQLVNIGTFGVYEIVDIIYDETRNKRVIIVDYTYEGVETSAIIYSIYNILPYEIYEFTILWGLFNIGDYNVSITNTDSVNGTVIYNSELINLEEEQTETLAIRYFNENNRDIFYKYGIEHFIRVPFVTVTAKQKEEQEINITDLSASVVESSVYELNEFKFDVLTREIMRKLVVSLSCEYVFINGQGYIKDGDINHENIENTNLYQVSVTMLKTGISYTNYNQGETGIDIDLTNFDIPQIITTGVNFIKA